MLIFAPSTGWPLSSLTTPFTMPVLCAAAGSAIDKATSATPANLTSWPFTRRTMGILLKMRAVERPSLPQRTARAALLVMQSLDRIEPRRLQRRVDAENQADED